MADDNSILRKLDGLESRFAEVGTLITDPGVIADRNRYVKLIAAYKNKYPEEFKKALDEVKAQPQLPGIPRFDISDEADAVSILKDAGLTI